MDVDIRDRTDRISAEVRACVDKKVRGLGDYLNLVTSADVRDQRATFDVVVTRMEAAAVRLKERIKAHP